ncbi:MAG: nucleoside monophosphate kinase [Buchnera aphidicola (Chaetogeoica yunlongensis)]
MKIVLLGAPGTGKGTQAQFIANKYKLSIISTGNILRNEIKKKTNLGFKIEEFIIKGKLVQNSIIMEIIKNELTQKKYKNGFILDGFPRTIEQAEYLKRNKTIINYVFEFKLSEEKILQRIKKRKIDAITGLTYNKKIFNKNNFQANNLISRSDDREEIIKKRLTEYKKYIVSLKNFYMQESNNYNLLYYEINSENKIEIINQKIQNYLENKNINYKCKTY